MIGGLLVAVRREEYARRLERDVVFAERAVLRVVRRRHVACPTTRRGGRLRRRIG